jgi:hypothetical protein
MNQRTVMSPELSSVCPDPAGVPATAPDNGVVADRPREMSLLLQAQEDHNPFRVAACRRAAAIRAALTQRLGRARRAPRASRAASGEAKSAVQDLLEVDRQHRAGCAEHKVPTIAARRFNPLGDAWLPVLHKWLGDWAYTALYSHTARAHEPRREHDWVAIHAEDRAHHVRQHTVLTATHGRHGGMRVMRGRESESVPPEAPLHPGQAATPRSHP